MDEQKPDGRAVGLSAGLERKARYRAVTHGYDCEKKVHRGEGHLHAASDDAPYFVDGLAYCGRCHCWLGQRYNAGVRLMRYNGGLTMDSTDSTVHLKRLVARLYEHADAHGTQHPQDDEQRTWEDDLREAASRLEKMALALRIVHTWASVPGALDPKHTAAMAANALRQC